LGTPVWWSGNVINVSLQSNSSQNRYISKFEIWWTGTPTLNNVVFESQKNGNSTVWGGPGVANSSPTYVTFSSSFYFQNYDYIWVRFNYNQNASSAGVTFVKFTFADGCYVLWGSHP
jgi:hypothetical protein